MEPWASLYEQHRVRDAIDDAELRRLRRQALEIPYMMENTDAEFSRVRDLALPAPDGPPQP